MEGDSALSLRKAFDQEKKIPLNTARNLLEQSELIKKLLETPKQRSDTFVGIRAYEWRLLELSEIPFTYTLQAVQDWLDILIEKSFINEGFALEGTKDHLLACHNALITTILLRLNYADKKKIDAGVDWILKYQSVERGKECNWPGKDLYTRFGGCMKKLPCYYGVVKSMITLTDYKKQFEGSDEIDTKLAQGLDYILQHRVYKKLSSDQPIEDSILLNFYPYTYRSNIIEILTLLKSNGRLKDERCQDAMQVLKSKQRSDGYWQADISYMKSAWIDFDLPKNAGLWLSYVVSQILEH